jgi:uncharacterized membrane protein YkoI
MRQILVAAALAALAVPALAQDEQKITMDQVPPAAMEAAKAKANGVEFTAVALDNDEGTATYELSGKMQNGMMLEIDVLEDGTVEEVEEQVEMSVVPDAVKEALEKNLKGFQPEMAEKSTRPDMVVYEFDGTHDGKEIDVEIQEDGSNYTMNDDLAG